MLACLASTISNQGGKRPADHVVIGFNGFNNGSNEPRSDWAPTTCRDVLCKSSRVMLKWQEPFPHLMAMKDRAPRLGKDSEEDWASPRRARASIASGACAVCEVRWTDSSLSSSRPRFAQSIACVCITRPHPAPISTCSRDTQHGRNATPPRSTYLRLSILVLQYPQGSTATTQAHANHSASMRKHGLSSPEQLPGAGRQYHGVRVGS